MSKHQGVSCDACQRNNFTGKRYKCLVCYDYDLCSDCYQNHVINARRTSPESSESSGSSRDSGPEDDVTKPAPPRLKGKAASKGGVMRRPLPPKKQHPHPRTQVPSSLATSAGSGQGGVSLHEPNHAMQCILTPTDYDACFGGENTSRHAQSFVCPHCGQLGFSEKGLYEHVVREHAKSRKEFICPLCAGNPGRDPNCMFDDFPTHYNLDHKTAYREIASSNAANPNAPGSTSVTANIPPPSGPGPKRRQLFSTAAVGGLQRTGATRRTGRPGPSEPVSSYAGSSPFTSLLAYLNDRSIVASHNATAPGGSGQRQSATSNGQAPRRGGAKETTAAVPSSRDRRRKGPGPFFVKLSGSSSADPTSSEHPVVLIGDDGDDVMDDAVVIDGFGGLLDDLLAAAELENEGMIDDVTEDSRSSTSQSDEVIIDDDVTDREGFGLGTTSSSSSSTVSGLTESTEECFDDVIAQTWPDSAPPPTSSQGIWQDSALDMPPNLAPPRKTGRRRKGSRPTQPHPRHLSDGVADHITAKASLTDESDDVGGVTALAKWSEPPLRGRESDPHPPEFMAGSQERMIMENEMASAWNDLGGSETSHAGPQEESSCSQEPSVEPNSSEESGSLNAFAPPPVPTPANDYNSTNLYKGDTELLNYTKILSTELSKYRQSHANPHPDLFGGDESSAGPAVHDHVTEAAAKRSQLARHLLATSIASRSIVASSNDMNPDSRAPYALVFWGDGCGREPPRDLPEGGIGPADHSQLDAPSISGKVQLYDVPQPINNRTKCIGDDSAVTNYSSSSLKFHEASAVRVVSDKRGTVGIGTSARGGAKGTPSPPPNYVARTTRRTGGVLPVNHVSGRGGGGTIPSPQPVRPETGKNGGVSVSGVARSVGTTTKRTTTTSTNKTKTASPCRVTNFGIHGKPGNNPLKMVATASPNLVAVAKVTTATNVHNSSAGSSSGTPTTTSNTTTNNGDDRPVRNSPPGTRVVAPRTADRSASSSHICNGSNRGSADKIDSHHDPP